MCRHARIVTSATALIVVGAALPAAEPVRMATVFQPHRWLDPASPSGGEEPTAPPTRTPYVAGMVGSSFAAGDSGGLGVSLVTGEGAIGVSLPRPAGAVRLEVEGRQRAALSGTRLDAGDGATEIADEWTTMANVWRDVSVAEHLSLYAGGGAGVGGYAHDPDAGGPTAAGRVTAFAWQAGGGAAYALTDRLTLDVGCRLYGFVADGGQPAAGDPAAELLFAVRIADPLRGWLPR
jgi:opacity protein-like surface antigen